MPPSTEGCSAGSEKSMSVTGLARIHLKTDNAWLEFPYTNKMPGVL